MASVTNLIKEIQDRPAMYFSRHEIESCSAFIAGWLHAQDHLEDEDVWLGFQDWIRARYSVTGTQGWAHIIAFNASDSSHALDLFFKLFAKYLDERREKPARTETR
jgi:hypothetical protein